MTFPTRFAAVAACALCLAAAPAAFAQQATTNSNPGTMSMEHGKDAAMSHSGHMMSNKEKTSGMAQSGMAQSGMTHSGMTHGGAMSHSGDKMDSMEK